MLIATSTAELLWAVSLAAITATVRTREHVRELDAQGVLRPAKQPEETTTSNLLSNLAYYGQHLSGIIAVAHTKGLEGGYKKDGVQVRVPSGADLELAIEISPGKWLNLLLQAKALKPSTNMTWDRYTSWNVKQCADLVNWADANGRVPGMLLYNDHVPPFVSHHPPTVAIDHMDWTCTAFGACVLANVTLPLPILEAWDPGWVHGPLYGQLKGLATPGGISLCLDRNWMARDAPSPHEIEPTHFPIEHLTHTVFCCRHSSVGDGDNGGGESLADLSAPEPPDWAQQLLASANNEADSGDRQDPDGPDREAAAYASAVVPFHPDERLN